ncbi:hypothetical protein IWT140_01730 [Secundilactobacillus pentosiphilus]|uniref:Uncharacterized protein n=1 Tax=Secundilactobacillus pentosiphilus TaxID=1714682 RepID=A0A1Z5IQQ3_9LACO|nr:hypothetical protein IWT140_01730 [Secundilactobacillus pentosiphilus]
MLGAMPKIERCSFCHGYGVFLQNHGACLVYDGGNVIKLMQGKEHEQKISDNGVALHIRYCPFCGRRLRN